MSDTTKFDQIEEEILSYEVSDEALETAAGTGKEKAGTIRSVSAADCPSARPDVLKRSRIPIPDRQTDEILTRRRVFRRFVIFFQDRFFFCLCSTRQRSFTSVDGLFRHFSVVTAPQHHHATKKVVRIGRMYVITTLPDSLRNSALQQTAACTFEPTPGLLRGRQQAEACYRCTPETHRRILCGLAFPRPVLQSNLLRCAPACLRHKRKTHSHRQNRSLGLRASLEYQINRRSLLKSALLMFAARWLPLPDWTSSAEAQENGKFGLAARRIAVR